MKILTIKMKIGFLILLLAVGAAAQTNKKLAQSGFQFLSVSSDAHAAAIGNAVTGKGMGSSSLFFNPAGMARLDRKFDFSVSMNNWIADIVYTSFNIGFRPANGSLGVIGLSVQSINYGEILGTIVADNTLGYDDTGNISASSIAIGLGYAKMISTKFSSGGQLKWVHQALGESIVPATDSTTSVVQNNLSALAYDFGTLYQTDYKGLAFGMSVRNFSDEIKFVRDGFQLPLTFQLGIILDLMEVVGSSNTNQDLLLTIDATHPRSHPEELIVGLDYKLLDMLSLRCGYVTNNDESNVSFGFGIERSGFVLDYAYTPFGVFDNVQRFTIRMSR